MSSPLFPPQRDWIAIGIEEVRELAGGVFSGRFGDKVFGFQRREAPSLLSHALTDPHPS